MNRYGLDDDCDALPYLDTPGICNRCGKKLTGRQSQWCSAECSNSLARDHDWNSARLAAKSRDGHRCVRCGERPRSRRRIEKIDPTRIWTKHRLERLGIEVVNPIPGQLVSVYDWDVYLEVNHIVPRVGQGYGFGCHNHLSNLETLCHPCHVDETTRQGRERRLIKKLAAPGTLFDEVST